MGRTVEKNYTACGRINKLFVNRNIIKLIFAKVSICIET